MTYLTIKGKTYRVDTQGFLVDFNDWDEEFARGTAPKVRIIHGLTREHWDIIHFVRNDFKENGKCPLVYHTCRKNGLRIKELKNLFPTGYLRGACRLAGITYKASYSKQSLLPVSNSDLYALSCNNSEKTYSVDARGFLVNPGEWDELYAVNKAFEMKIKGELTEAHWRIIHFLRERFIKNKAVPTVYETCEAHNLEIEELERLFPDGYHRGAVKIAGLRVI